MDIEVQTAKAEAFRKMHDRTSVLVLPNAWDAATARLFAHLGFGAIATTSGGVAWALGYPDGELAPRDEVLGTLRRIVRGNAPGTRRAVGRTAGSEGHPRDGKVRRARIRIAATGGAAVDG